ncbi:MAG: GDSL-type esterase/lipase family protein [Halioglobus sp.]
MSKRTWFVLVVFAVAVGWPAYRFYVEIDKASSEDPLVWEADIRALERRAEGQFPAHTAVVFVGSSSIRLWDSLAKDMAPVPVIRQGFGGAKLNDVVHYAERLVSVHRPRAVVVFAGTNDIQPGRSKSPAALLAAYQTLVRTVRREQPELPVYFIAITPSPMRWAVWDVALETNRLITEYSAGDQNLHVIDTGPALLGADGKPERANYVFDGLHLSAQGYAIWTSIIRPPLLAELGL